MPLNLEPKRTAPVPGVLVGEGNLENLNTLRNSVLYFLTDKLKSSSSFFFVLEGVIVVLLKETASLN